MPLQKINHLFTLHRSYMRIIVFIQALKENQSSLRFINQVVCNIVYY